ncbi:polymer-forming cytoskeletal protein [bacterium SCSIO 12696]|nr:polymer-forming cytoskeletal protein [bacterium SCSIO 12696]
MVLSRKTCWFRCGLQASQRKPWSKNFNGRWRPKLWRTSNVKNKKSAANNFNNGATTLIAEGTEISGEIRFYGNLEIEGKVIGNVIAMDADKSRVRVLQSGQVQGEIQAPAVVVNGLVEGDLQVTQYLELAARAVVDGNVHYRLIEVEKGAQVNGSFIRMAKEEQSSRDRDSEDADGASARVEV